MLPAGETDDDARVGDERATSYCWQLRYRDEGEVGLLDRKPEPEAVWNRMQP